MKNERTYAPQIAKAVALTLPASVCIVLLIRVAAVRILHPGPAFAPLTPGPEILDTAFGVGAAAFVFTRISQTSSQPLRTWRLVAVWALGISFIPDLLLAATHGFGGAWPEAIALMLMHVAVWALCVTLLPGMAGVSRQTKPPQALESIFRGGSNDV